MVRSIVAVAAGYAMMVVLVMTFTIGWVATHLPGGLKAMRANPKAVELAASPFYLAMNLAYSLLAAIVGGWVTVTIAGSAPNGHLLALGALVVVMGVVATFAPGSERQPPWYKYVIPVIGVAGVALSALFVSRGMI